MKTIVRRAPVRPHSLVAGASIAGNPTPRSGRSSPDSL